MVLRDALAPRASFKFEDLDVNGLSQGTISRVELLAMSRGNLKSHLNYGSDEDSSYLQGVRKLWWALLITIRDTSVVDGHMTAVCNAICVFLQSASSSRVLSIQAFAMSAETWTVVFDALLDRLDGGKLKPLRQVLNTLIKILGRHDDSSKAQIIRDDVLSKMASIILLGKPTTHFKASMVIFEALVRSGVPASRTLFAIGRGHGSNYQQWDLRLRRVGMDATELCTVMDRYVVDESICSFSFSIILAVADSSVQATAGTFFTSFMSMLTGYGVPLGPLWVEIVVTILRRHPEAIEAFKNYLLPSILKLHPSHYNYLLHKTATENAASSMLQNALTIAILGCKEGLVSEEDIAIYLHKILEAGRGRSLECLRDNLDNTKLYESLLTHISAGVRVRAYQFLVTSSGTAKPFQRSTLRLLSKHLVYLHGDADPGNRGEINGITNAMVLRLRWGSSFHARALAKPHLPDQESTEHKDGLLEHEIFLDCFIRFLESELGPNCSFTRHFSALRALQLLVESGLDPMMPPKVAPKTSQDLPRWPLKKSLHYQRMKLALLHLLIDPFEEVRAATILVLKLILGNTKVKIKSLSHNTSDDRQLRKWVKNGPTLLSTDAEELGWHPNREIVRLEGAANRLAALTNRADHADGVARLLGLQNLFAPRRSAVVCGMLERLDTALGLSDGEMSLPAKDFSVHGYLIGLKYITEDSGFEDDLDSGMILKETDVTVHRLLNLCNGVWRAVRNDLCVDSPELSRDADAVSPFEGPKDFLSYSWRALRDSSLLLQAILLHLGSRAGEALAGNGRVEHLRTIHSLCLEQLTALRHRGAFSTVAQTFALCCEQFANVTSLRAEVKTWYQDAFQILEDQSSNLTRRSAGIPAIMASLLIPSNLEEFNGVIETLASLAKSEITVFNSMTNDQQTHLPQVHALNCLQNIFTNFRFKGRTVSWLIKVLDIAASSLSSDVWAIRNCGLMLFRACASRFGTAAEVSSFESSGFAVQNQSEAVLGIAVRLLRSGQQIDLDSAELVFAGLDLMGRIIVPRTVRSEFTEQVLIQLGSPIWMIREHAARLYASQMPEIDALGAAIHLISSIVLSDQNKSHGILLSSRELLGKHFNASLPLSDAELLSLEQALKYHAPSIQQHAAPAVRSAFLDIVNDFITLHHRSVIQLQNSSLRRLDWTRQFRYSYRCEPQVGFGRPFESQLLSSSALNSCVLVLTGFSGTAHDLHQTFQNVASHDLDAAAALLHALIDQWVPDHRALRLLVDFYIGIVDDDYDEDITVAALLGLSSCLECVEESKDSLITKHDLRSLACSFVNLPSSGCRDLFNARIRGLGSVLAYGSKKAWPLWTQYSLMPLTIWIEMLSSAVKDATEVLTRLNAAKSLHCFRRCFLQDSDSVGEYRKFVLYSILYDLLNDDDEEIRDLAASTTSFILTSAADGGELRMCPLAACHRFAGYIVDNFTSLAQWHLTAFSRLMLPTTNELDVLDNFAALASIHSVRNQLELARQESHDLFEEERQNLYLDDIREVDIWFLALGKVSRTWIDDDITIMVAAWALDGLRELTAALPSLTSGPFGVMSKLEIITLFIRVIRLADLSLQWDNSSDWGIAPPQRPSYLIEMERLQHAAREYPIHPQAQRALDDTVRSAHLDFERLEKQWEDRDYPN